MENPQHNLAMDLVRVTEAAALASGRWLGKGDKNAGDKNAGFFSTAIEDTTQLIVPAICVY